MSVESSFFKDRPANIDEIRNLTEGTPDVQSVAEREDILHISAIDPGAEEQSLETKSGHEVRGIYPQTWYFRMN